MDSKSTINKKLLIVASVANLLRAVSSSDDPFLRDDGSTAEVESKAVLQGHLPGDLSGSSLRATDNPVASLEELVTAELVDATY
jgi:hypothetical protein